MLIRDAELGFGAQRADLRIAAGRIAAIGARLPAQPGEPVIEARGGALLPGLHDHHLHLQALAAARASLRCGPPQVQDEAGLIRTLQAQRDGSGWLRGIGYHESVAGDIDRDWLDRHGPARPLRIQQRSGRLWILNSAALQRLGLRDDAPGSDPLERRDGRLSGRLYDADDWLRARLQGARPDLAPLSRELARRGVTGLTDTSPHNGPEDFAHFAAARARGELLQDLLVMGDARLDGTAAACGVQRGAHKFHLHDHQLPDFDALCADIRRAHAAGRAAAFHCVSRVDLTFALAALQQAGVRGGDRIEHAAVAPPELVETMAALGVAVVTQPAFVAERGDAYLEDVAQEDRPWLYRLRGLLDAGIALAGSTDAPYGDADPWAAMQAAVARRTAGGRSLGPEEALSPEQAFGLFAGSALQPGGPARRIAVGARADLCLLEQPWQALRAQLGSAAVRCTLRGGACIAGADGC